MLSPSKRKQGLGYKANGEIKADTSRVNGPLQNGGKNDTIHPNGQGVGGFPQHPNTKVEAHQTNGRYQAQSEAARQSRDVKTDEETNLQTLAVSENARQLLKVLQPFEARITELEAEIHTLQMDSREKEATLQDLERKILRLQQDSQDRVTALEDEIADLQEQGQKDTDYLNEGIELARVSLDNKNAMPRQLEAELQSVKLDSQEKDDIIMALSLESKEKDETISALKSEVSRLETARVKAEDELQWWKLENCNGRDQQNHIQDTPHSHQDVDAGISHIHQSGRKESTN